MKKNKAIQLVAISGSLKSTSSNTNILRNLARFAPEAVKIRIFEGLDSLPHFNPDKPGEVDEVNSFRQPLRNF